MPRRPTLHLLLVAGSVFGVKEQEFRKCPDTPFCGKHRALPADATPWTLEVASTEANVAAADKTIWSARLLPPDASQLALRLDISVLRSGAVRVSMQDDPSLPLESLEMDDPTVAKPEGWDDDMDGAWEGPKIRLGRAVKPRFKPQEPFASAASLEGVELRCTNCGDAQRPASILVASAGGGQVVVRVTHAPLRVELMADESASSAPLVSLNGRNRLHYEPFRQVLEGESSAVKAADPVTFRSFSDPMTFGSSSVGMDVDFPRASHAYGIPERTVAHALPPTLGREPYRLMNLDVFEYVLDHQMGIYGSVPFLQVHVRTPSLPWSLAALASPLIVHQPPVRR